MGIFTGKSPKTPTEDFHVDTSQNSAIQQCPQCPQVFTRKSILDIHIRHAHKDKSLEENEIKTEESENSKEGTESTEKLVQNTNNGTESAEKTINHTVDTTEPKQVDEANEKVAIIKKKKIKVENKVEEPEEQIEERVEEAKEQ